MPVRGTAAGLPCGQGKIDVPSTPPPRSEVVLRAESDRTRSQAVLAAAVHNSITSAATASTSLRLPFDQQSQPLPHLLHRR